MESRWGLVLMLMRAGILVVGVVLMVVGVMVMVKVRVVSFSEGRCLPEAEVECVVVGCGLVEDDVLNFGGGFVVVVVCSKLEVAAVVRVVCSCKNGELYYLWHLSRKSLEGKMFNFGGRLIGVVMPADSLMECWL